MGESRASDDADGSSSAPESLSRRYRGALLRYFARRGIHPVDAEDLTQEVFARLSKKGALDGVASTEGYLFAIAANVIVDHIRRSKIRSKDLSTEIYGSVQATDDFSPERVLEGRQELLRIVAALNEMPERMRTIFILARLENLPRGEIAQRLDISKSLVEQQIALATACLAERRKRWS